MSTNPFQPGPARHLIANQWVAAGDLRTSIDPATGESLGEYHDADLDVARAAIAAARSAFDDLDWRHDRERRAAALWDLADAVEHELEAIARAISLENGKPLDQARFELSIAAPKLRYFAGLALTDVGSAATVYRGATSMLLKEPIGVAGIIVPWNSPGILSIRSLAPALAAGCTAAVKMPAQTALANSLLAEVFASVASLPSGVVNWFTESGDAGAKELVASTQTAVVSYTGSSAVGAQIAAATGAALKRASLELGGKTPMVIFPDADLDQVIPALIGGITVFAGQFCMTGSRILVHEAIADVVAERLRAGLADVVIGPGLESGTQMGPLIDTASVERVDAFLATHARDFIVRGGRVEGPGAFYRPTIVAVQDLESPLIQEEIFGPVATFETFASESEAIQRANATDYGLAASVWTADGARSLRVSHAIEAGTVWTNAWAQILDQFEEGGYKKSGLGRLNGPGGLAEFQEVKHVYRTSV